MSYGTDRLDMFRRDATHVDKILKVAQPADLPVEQPSKLDPVSIRAKSHILGNRRLAARPTIRF